MTSELVLALLDFEKDFTDDCDDSLVVIGALLRQ